MSPVTMPEALVFVAPNVISVPHWRRLREGRLLATSPRLSWARLLARTFRGAQERSDEHPVDVLECVSCGGRLRVLGVVEERAFGCAHIGRPSVADEIPDRA